MLQNELLQVKEGPLVVDLLADLHQGVPCIFRSEFRAVGALSVYNDILNLKYLLEDCRSEDLEIASSVDPRGSIPGHPTHFFLDR